MRISVALCAYQAERFLLEQLESIAAQSRLPDELVVCDDASTDATVAIVEQFAANAAFPVHLHVNVTRLGYSRNFEQAIGHCQGDAIALADHDDIWMSPKLAAVVAAFSAPDKPGLVFSDGDFVDECGRPLGGTCWSSVGLDRRAIEEVSNGNAFRVLFDRTARNGGAITGATMAFGASYRDLVVPFPEWMPRSGKGPLIHDAWIALLIGAVAPVTALPEQLVRYRRHAAQQIGLKGASSRSRWTAKPRTTRRGGIPTSQGRLVGLQAVRDRLIEHQGHYDVGPAVDVLDDFLRHARARERLPSSRVRRTGAIVRELRTGAYRRYSNGLASAARDLLARRPRAS